MSGHDRLGSHGENVLFLQWEYDGFIANSQKDFVTKDFIAFFLFSAVIDSRNEIQL